MRRETYKNFPRFCMLLDVDDVDYMLSTSPMSHLELLVYQTDFTTYLSSLMKNLGSLVKILPDFRTV
jgi:hypothetical protein